MIGTSTLKRIETKLLRLSGHRFVQRSTTRRAGSGVRHDTGSELHFRRLRPRILILLTAASVLFTSVSWGQSDVSAADSRSLDFKQFGLLAIQDGGRRKPIDTFARETLIRLTGRSAYTDKTGRKWQPNDFVLSALLETHDWKNEPMVLVSFGKLKEQLGLDKTQRHFSFTQLAGSTELSRLANEAQALKRAEKSLDRVQQEAISVSDRLALFGNVMNGSALLIVPSPRSPTDLWVVPRSGRGRGLLRRNTVFSGSV
jgi:hypothetical protein